MSTVKQRLTKEGKSRLQEKLKRLEAQDLKEATARVQAARKFCDFHEDPVYRQYFDEATDVREEIEQLKNVLAHAVVIAPTQYVTIEEGHHVTLTDLTHQEKLEFKIVPSLEADIELNEISSESPLGQRLMHKKIGDSFVLNDSTYRIEAIQ